MSKTKIQLPKDLMLGQEDIVQAEAEDGVLPSELQDPDVFVAGRDGELVLTVDEDDLGRAVLYPMDESDTELASGEVVERPQDGQELEFIDEADLPPPADPNNATAADYARQRIYWRAYSATALDQILEAWEDLGKAQQRCSLHPFRHSDIGVVRSKLREAELMLQGIIRRPHEDDDKL